LSEGGFTKKHVRPAEGLPEKVVSLSVTATRGPDAGKHHRAAPRERVSVGTAEDNDFVLVDATVSRYHLELEPTETGVRVKDLGSSNGTYLGRSRLFEAEVPPDSQLRLGDTFVVVSSAEQTLAVDAPEIPGLVTRSVRMHEVLRQVKRLASFPGSVLVLGETGTGKELVARALHDEGPRKKGPFVVVDCGALPHHLVESELFGHERGAFTGAIARHLGAFERAHGGTVFLDEIGELPTSAQAALLGALERKRVRRVGGDREVELDVKVVSATHRDLRAEVNRAAFRADLYFRIAAARVVLPALRERPEDIPLLVRHFAFETAGEEAIVPSELVEAWQRQHWAGNVRELRNAVERALSGDHDPSDMPPTGVPRATTSASDAPVERYRDARARVVAEFERAYVTSLIARAEGNASEAARLAKMDRPYLLTLLKKYDLR
jgi:DNA-binding NtrC family response regulator